jgi:predicted ArsR family transcriptional regulator
MPLTFTNEECADKNFVSGFYNRKNRDIVADYQQLCTDHTATNCNTLQKLLRILKETGFFPRVKAQRGHPRLVEDNVLGAGQRSPRSKSIHGIKS